MVWVNAMKDDATSSCTKHFGRADCCCHHLGIQRGQTRNDCKTVPKKGNIEMDTCKNGFKTLAAAQMPEHVIDMKSCCCYTCNRFMAWFCKENRPAGELHYSCCIQFKMIRPRMFFDLPWYKDSRSRTRLFVLLLAFQKPNWRYFVEIIASAASRQ